MKTKRFLVQRTASGFTREIELDATDEQDAITRADALFTHEGVQASYNAKRTR